jgi:SAM-dependent methyltransferase
VIREAKMEVSNEPSIGPVILSDTDDPGSSDSIVKAFFDERWREHEDQLESSIYPFDNPLMREILRTWKGEKSICDVGCGDGRFAIDFAQKGCRVHAIDFSPSALVRLKNRAAHYGLADLLKGLDAPQDARKLTVEKENRFELVVIANMLHYLSPLEVIQLIKDFADSLRSRDQLYIGLETSIQMKYDDSRYFTFAGQYNHFPNRIESLLEQVGLQVDDKRGPEPIRESFNLPPVLNQRLGAHLKDYERDFLLYEFLATKP